MPGTTGRSGGNRHPFDDNTAHDGLPAEPDGLTAAVSAKWQQLMEQLPHDALRQIDQHMIKQLAVLLAAADELADRITSDPMDDKARRLNLQTCDRISRFSAQFGLTPLDRRRAKLEPDTPTDADSELVARLLERGLS